LRKWRRDDDKQDRQAGWILLTMVGDEPVTVHQTNRVGAALNPSGEAEFTDHNGSFAVERPLRISYE